MGRSSFSTFDGLNCFFSYLRCQLGRLIQYLSVLKHNAWLVVRFEIALISCAPLKLLKLLIIIAWIYFPSSLDGLIGYSNLVDTYFTTQLR